MTGDFFFYKKIVIYLFVFGCALVFVPAWPFFLVVASSGISLWWFLLLWSMGARHSGSVVAVPRLQITGSVVVAHGLSCPEACWISPDQGSNPSLLHWQEDSLTTEPPEKPEGTFLRSGDPLPLKWAS